MVLSSSTLRARWIEAEVIHLKKMGFTFERIADHITRVGCGQAQAMTGQPHGLIFPPDFTITRQACHKAFKKALAREPAAKVAEMRKLDTARCEDYIMYLQPSIVKSDERSISTAVAVLKHKARINGYLQSKAEIIEQREKEEEEEKEKSKAELRDDDARKLELFFAAIQILVERGTPLHQILHIKQPPIDTIQAKLLSTRADDHLE